MGWVRGAGRASRTYDLYISEPILAEVSAKLLAKFKLPTEIVVAYIAEVRTVAALVDPLDRVTAVDRDPDDDMVLECAIAAQAHLIITADRDLLQLRQYRDIGIYHPTNLKYFFPEDLGRTA